MAKSPATALCRVYRPVGGAPRTACGLCRAGSDERGIPQINGQGTIAFREGPVGRVEGQYFLLVPLNQREGSYADWQLPQMRELGCVDSELAWGYTRCDRAGAQHRDGEK